LFNGKPQAPAFPTPPKRNDPLSMTPTYGQRPILQIMFILSK
jgi:hypothetical protein